MDSVPGYVVFIGGLVLAALIVSSGFFIYNQQKETSDTVVAQNEKLNTQLQEEEWTQYVGDLIPGSQVVNVIKRMYDSGTYVSVTIGGAETYYIYTDNSLQNKMTDEEYAEALTNAKTRGSSTYINPNSDFLGTLDRDETTDAILGIKFVKATENP